MNVPSTESDSGPEKHVNADLPGTFRLGYRPELDGFRGISILLVLIHHLYHPLMPGGFLGVDMFFVLSGFLITSLLVEEWHQYGSISLKNFYVRRFLRLMPAVLLLILVLSVFAFLIQEKETAAKTFQAVWLTLSYGSNWFYAFDVFSANNPLGVTWSLAIEEQFYLAFPLLLLLALKLKLKHTSIVFLLLLSIIVIAFNRWSLAGQDVTIERVYYASDTRADALLVGCLVAFFASWGLFSYKSVQLYLKIGSILALVFMCFMIGTASTSDVTLYETGYVLIEISIAVLLIVIVVYRPRAIVRILGFSPLVWIGRVSYGLYLWHWCVRYYIYDGQSLPASYIQFTVALCLSFLLTLCSFYLVEKPILRLKGRFTHDNHPPAVNSLIAEMT